MFPQTHFLLPFFLAEILVKFNLLDHKAAILAGLLAVFIDIDHYVAYVINHRYKDFSVKRAWNASVIKQKRDITFIHHPLAFIVVLIILAILYVYNNSWLLIIGLAYFPHLILDGIEGGLRKYNPRYFRIKKYGFMIDISYYELVLDIVLIISIIILLVI